MRINHEIMIIISYAEHVITAHTSTATATTLHVNAPSRPLSVSSLFYTTHHHHYYYSLFIFCFLSSINPIQLVLL